MLDLQCEISEQYWAMLNVVSTFLSDNSSLPSYGGSYGRLMSSCFVHGNTCLYALFPLQGAQYATGMEAIWYNWAGLAGLLSSLLRALQRNVYVIDDVVLLLFTFDGFLYVRCRPWNWDQLWWQAHSTLFCYTSFRQSLRKPHKHNPKEKSLMCMFIGLLPTLSDNEQGNLNAAPVSFALWTVRRVRLICQLTFLSQTRLRIPWPGGHAFSNRICRRCHDRLTRIGSWFLRSVDTRHLETSSAGDFSLSATWTNGGC